MSTSTKLEQFKSLVENINLDIKESVLASIRDIRQLVGNLNLTNLREVCRSEHVDRLIAAVLMCIKEGHFETGKQVIDFLVCAGYKDDSNRPLLCTTPLHRAFRYDYYIAQSVCSQLFAIYNIRYDVNYTDELGLSHFHMACAFGLESVVEKFLDFGGIVPDRMLTKARESPLYLASRYFSKNVVKNLLKHGADPNLILNDEEQTLLHLISKKYYHYGSRTAMLIDFSQEFKPVLIDARDKYACTALHLAIMRCARRGTTKETAVEVLLDRGADPNLTNSQGYTALHFICNHGRRSVDLVKLLMNRSAAEHLPLRIDARDAEGNTPLHLALQSKRIPLAEFLLEQGASPNLTNAKNESALHLISRRRVSDRALKILFDRPEELRIDAQDQEGNTPLHLALMRYGNKKAAEYLLSRGGDPILANAEGLTPLRICLKDEHEASAKLFGQMIDRLHLSRRAQFRRALACLLAPGELDVLLGRGADEKLSKKIKNQSVISKFRLVTGVLILVLSYEDREGERKQQLEPSDAMIIMKMFEQYKLLQKPTKQGEKRWYDDEEFTSKAKSITIVPDLSLNDLVRMRPESQMRRISYRDYLEFAHSKKLNELQAKHRNPCILQLCELMARGFFRRFALMDQFRLMHKQVPVEVCEIIVQHLDNQSLYNTCLAATGKSSIKEGEINLKTKVKRKGSKKEPPSTKKAKN